MDAWHHDARSTIYNGDCLEVLKALPDASVDAVVTDPPYGLEFMGKAWDAFRLDDPGTTRHRGDRAGDHGQAREDDDRGAFGRVAYGGGKRPTTFRCVGCGKRDQFRNVHACGEGVEWRREIIDPHAAPPTMLAFGEWSRLWAIECLRVLKPGGHLLAFGGTRTWHRLACAIEDAGFEVRDSIAWMYGSGFPKSLDVSKAIDKAAGAEREVVGIDHEWVKRVGSSPTTSSTYTHSRHGKSGPNGGQLTAPATDAAREWSGWGTALKPAHEPIVVARKPLVGTVAANVLEHGTGALNIDACRIGYASDADKDKALAGDAFKRKDTSDKGWSRPWMEDPERVAQMNAESKARAQAGRWPANVVLDEDQAAELDRQSGWSKTPSKVTRGPDRSPSSFGLRTEAEVAACYGDSGGASRFFYVAKAPVKERPKVDGTAHPTVKPLTLMRWLCRLVTPPDGVILEPFAGSGTTVEAALLEGFRVVAIEREADYLPLIQARLDRVAATEPDDEQLTLDASA
jgi:site-specific DNA-methyltransferase (adenine-specific)